MIEKSRMEEIRCGFFSQYFGIVFAPTLSNIQN